MSIASRSLLIGRNVAKLLRTRPSGIASRDFHSTCSRSTDGVYTALSDMRVKTPWVEALKCRQAGRESPSPSVLLTERDVRPRKMSGSYHSIILPLAQDPWLLDSYLNASGHIRLGTIFMDLDALSGVVAYKHTGESVMTVTAAVDRITIKHSLTEICDLELSGQVTFATGRSSMEVSMRVAKAPASGHEVKDEDVLMTCAFTMVSLDPHTKKPVPVSPLKLESPEDHRLFALGQENYNAKKALANTALLSHTPNDEESDLIHGLWLRQLAYQNPAVPVQKPTYETYMHDTRIHSTQIMQPQYRNRHNFMIFGGFLLKQTFELAFSCAASFAHARPRFVSLDPSTFNNPVPVGSVLYLTATVAYTDSSDETSHDDEAGHNSGASEYTRIQVRVDSKVRDVEHAESKPTGQFNYTFLVAKRIRVMPKTYGEFMIWVDARRRAEKVTAGWRQEGERLME